MKLVTSSCERVRAALKLAAESGEVECRLALRIAAEDAARQTGRAEEATEDADDDRVARIRRSRHCRCLPGAPGF
jgi:hypothetical protein